MPRTDPRPTPAPDPHGVQARRLALGMTQAQLADALGVTASTVRRWEAGSMEPSAPALKLLGFLCAAAGLRDGEKK